MKDKKNLIEYLPYRIKILNWRSPLGGSKYYPYTKKNKIFIYFGDTYLDSSNNSNVITNITKRKSFIRAFIDGFNYK